jgi:putative endonuclease
MEVIAYMYILTNNHNHMLYIGMTTDLRTRMWEHRTKRNPKSFTARYNVCKLIYVEGFETVDEAVARERFIKGKSRKWKEALIRSKNPAWKEIVIE